MGQVDFRVLGPVTVTREGAPIKLRPKEVHVLGALLTSPGRPVAAEALVVDLWGDDAPPSMVKSLHVHIAHLRAALRSAADGPSRVVTTPAGYAVDLEPDELDLARLSAAVGRARKLRESDPLGAIAVLRAGLIEWRGTPFGALGSPMIDLHRAYAAHLHVSAAVELCTLLARHSSNPDPTEATRLLGDNPTVEPLALALATMLYRRGDSVGALGTLRRFRRRLLHEFGLEPTAALGDLEHRILIHEVEPPQTRSAVAPPAATTSRPPGLAEALSRPGGRIGSCRGARVGPVEHPA